MRISGTSQVFVDKNTSRARIRGWTAASPRQRLFLVFGTLWLLASGYVAFTQPLAVNPLRDQLSLAEWFLTPIEFNPEARLPNIDAATRGIAAPSGTNRVCIVGASELILTSSDHGATWTHTTVPKYPKELLSPSPPVPAPAPAPAPEPPIPPFDGKEEKPTPAAINNSFQPKSKFANGNSKRFTSRDGLVLFQSGAGPVSQNVLDTNNSNTRPTPPDTTNGRVPQISPAFYAIWFKDQDEGWCVGQYGAILHTTDGGATWEYEDCPTQNDLYDVHVIGDVGAIGGLGTGLVRTNAKWESIDKNNVLPKFAPAHVSQVLVESADQIALEIDDNFYLQFRASSSSSELGWYLASSPPALPIGYVARSDKYQRPFLRTLSPDSVLDVREDVYGILSRRAEETSDKQSSDESLGAYLDQPFPIADVSWNFKNEWVLMATDGQVAFVGEQKQPKKLTVAYSNQKLPFSPYRIAFSSAQHGYVLGLWGELFKTSDGGRTWFPISRQGWQARFPNKTMSSGRHVRLPGPWFYFSLLIGLGILVYGALPVERKDQDEKSSVSGIENKAFSDKPLENYNEDVLEFEPLVKGISRFLRNRDTIAPLTLTIEGPWGSGKSSFMNLLRADLCNEGFSTVWFNAWHHQREESLLAALLETLQNDAAPSLSDVSPHVIYYYVKMMGRKLQRPELIWPIFFLIPILVLLYGCQSHWSDIGSSLVPSEKETPAIAWYDISKIFATKPKVDESPWKKLLLLFGSAGTGAVLIYQIWNRLKALDIYPSGIFQWISSRQESDPRLQTSLRHRFAREFHDFCEAYKPRNLVIFIDDIDRCQPDVVAQLLEAINFLVSSGDCYVVCGTDYDHMLKSVKQANPHFAGDAEQYLEKLVNLRIPIPARSDDHYRELALGKARSTKPISDWDWFELGAMRVGRILQLSIVASLIFIASMVSYNVSLLINKAFEFNAPVSARVATRTNASKPGSIPRDTNPRFTPENASRPPSADYFGRVDVVKRETELTWEISAYLLSVALIFLIVLCWLRYDRDSVLSDSDEFNKAVSDWMPFIRSRIRTPRAIKRLMNRTRFHSMMLKQSAQTSTTRVEFDFILRFLRNIFYWLRPLIAEGLVESQRDQAEEGKENEVDSNKDASLGDRDLVVLTAVEQVDERLLNSDSPLDSIDGLKKLFDFEGGHQLLEELKGIRNGEATIKYDRLIRSAYNLNF